MALVDDLSAIRDSLVAELKGEAARRAALVALGNPPPATYTVAGKTVDWTGYMTAMQKLIQDQNALIVQVGGDGGLYEIVARGYS